MGDFNSPDIDWPSLTGCLAHSNALCNSLIQICQLINTPTQIMGNVLDWAFTSSEGVVKDLNIDPSYVQTFPTDHFLITFSIDGSYKPNRKNIPKFIDFKKADYKGLCEYLLEVDFHSCYSNSNVEKVRAFIKESILAAMPLFIPKIKLHSRQQPP